MILGCHAIIACSGKSEIYEDLSDKDNCTKDVKNRSKLDMRGDTLTVLKGLAGSYPNFFFDVKSEDIEAFVTACENLRSKKDYSRLVEQFGIRRTNPAFWKVADWFQERHAYAQPVESGILDLSRIGIFDQIVSDWKIITLRY